MSEQTYTPEQLDELRSLVGDLKQVKDGKLDIYNEMLVHVSNKTDLQQLFAYVQRLKSEKIDGYIKAAYEAVLLALKDRSTCSHKASEIALANKRVQYAYVRYFMSCIHHNIEIPSAVIDESESFGRGDGLSPLEIAYDLIEQQSKAA